MDNKTLLNLINKSKLKLDYYDIFCRQEIDHDIYDSVADYFEENKWDSVYGELPNSFINYMFEDQINPAEILKYKDKYLLYISESDDLFFGSLEDLNEYCKSCLLYNTLSNNYIPINNDSYKMIEKLADEKFGFNGYDSNDLSEEIYDLYYQNQEIKKTR